MSQNPLLSSRAAAELIGIWKFTAEETSPEIADRIVIRIESECRKVAEMPGIGHFRDDLLDRRYKFWSVYSYLIVYRCDRTPIQVVRIIHGARDLPGLLDEDV